MKLSCTAGLDMLIVVEGCVVEVLVVDYVECSFELVSIDQQS